MSEVRTNPFPGLRPFKFHEHELFFGREEQYEQMVAKLSRARFLAVVGTSGSGKSSLVRAGLLPALYGGLMMSAGSSWRVAIFRPKDDPIRELALALNHHRVFGSKCFENGSAYLKVGDILDWAALCSRLRDEANRDLPSPSRRIVELLPVNMARLIRETNGNGLEPGHRSSFVSECNRILKRRDFFEAKTFEKVAIKGEADLLLKLGAQNLSEAEVPKFNRLLLEAYYSTEIAKKAEIQTKITEVTLRRGDLGLVEAVRQARMPANENLLVVVDQFEELFRYARISENGPHGNQAAAFVKLLLEARNQTLLPIYVVLTMRSDYLGDCAEFWDLPEAINEGEYLIPRLTREQRREAIRGPIKLRGAKITPQLINQLLNDMGDSPDELPILQHALMRTWDNWSANHNDDEPIGIHHYNAIGRMAKALSLHADEAYDSLPEKSRKLAETIFKCLTERAMNARETRRPASLREIREVTGASVKEIATVINTFRRSDRSFLMPSARKPLKRGNSIDISHESLIRNWTRLKQWVDQEANAANTYRRLVQTARLYKTKHADLLSEVEVDYALKWRESNKPNSAWASRYHFDLPEIQKLYADVGSDCDRKACDRKVFSEAMAFLDTSSRERLRAREERKRQRKSQVRRLQATAAIFVLATIICFLCLQKANNEERIANLLTYAENVNSASSEIDRRNFGRAHELLDTLTDGNYKQLRGFELDYLTRPSPSLLKPKLRHDDSAVLSVAFLPRKNLLASVSADGTLRLWTLLKWQEDTWNEEGLLLRDLKTNNATAKRPVSLVAFSPDGERFATVDSTRKNLRIWRINAEKRFAELVGETQVMDKSNLLAIAFSEDGESLASGRSTKGTKSNLGLNSIEIWDTSNGSRQKAIEETSKEASLAMAFAANGTLAIGNSNGEIEVRDLTTLSKKAMVPPHAQVVSDMPTGPGDVSLAVGALASTPDGNILAAGRKDGNIDFWNTTSGERITFPAYPYPISDIVFSTDGQTLAAASENGSVKLWKTNRILETHGLEASTLTGHSGPVFGVAFQANTDLLATASGDKTARLWDTSIPEGLSAKRFSDPASKRVASLAFAPDDKTLAVAFSAVENMPTGRPEVDVKFLRTMTMLEETPLENSKVSFSGISPLPGLLATGKGNGSSALLTSREWKELSVVGGGLREFKAVAFFRSEDKLTIWSLVNGGTIYETTIKLSKSSKVLTSEHPTQVSSVAFSPDFELLAVGLETGEIELFSTHTGRLVERLRGHSANVLSLAFSRDGQKLATGSADKTVILWNTSQWSECVTLAGHQAPVQALVFSDDGRRLGSGSWDGAVKLWDADITNNRDLWQRLKRQELATLREHKNAVFSLAFSHDGLTLASADADNLVKLWKTRNQDN